MFYRLYQGKQELTDANGDRTGEWGASYGPPVQFRANVSPATGQSGVEQFGTLENYDKVIVTTDMSLPISEDTVLYIDQQPGEDSGNGQWLPHDYIVKRVARSINSISIACSKVKVS